MNLNLCSLAVLLAGGGGGYCKPGSVRVQICTPLVGTLHSVSSLAILMHPQYPSPPPRSFVDADTHGHRAGSPAQPASLVTLPLPSQLTRIGPENTFPPITRVSAAITHSPNSLWRCSPGSWTLLSRLSSRQILSSARQTPSQPGGAGQRLNYMYTVRKPISFGDKVSQERSGR